MRDHHQLLSDTIPPADLALILADHGTENTRGGARQCDNWDEDTWKESLQQRDLNIQKWEYETPLNIHPFVGESPDDRRHPDRWNLIIPLGQCSAQLLFYRLVRTFGRWPCPEGQYVVLMRLSGGGDPGQLELSDLFGTVFHRFPPSLSGFTTAVNDLLEWLFSDKIPHPDEPMPLGRTPAVSDAAGDLPVISFDSTGESDQPTGGDVDTAPTSVVHTLCDDGDFTRLGYESSVPLAVLYENIFPRYVHHANELRRRNQRLVDSLPPADLAMFSLGRGSDPDVSPDEDSIHWHWEHWANMKAKRDVFLQKWELVDSPGYHTFQAEDGSDERRNPDTRSILPRFISAHLWFYRIMRIFKDLPFSDGAWSVFIRLRGTQSIILEMSDLDGFAFIRCRPHDNELLSMATELVTWLASDDVPDPDEAKPLGSMGYKFHTFWVNGRHPDPDAYFN